MSQRAPATVGQRLEEVDTPALILDLDAFESNLQTPDRARSTAACACARTPRRTSARRSAKRQIALGAVGVCCQKVSEAEAMVDGGIADVLVTQRNRRRAEARAPRRAVAPRAHRRLRRQRATTCAQIAASRARSSTSTSRSKSACAAAASRRASRRWRWRARSRSARTCASPACRPTTAARSTSAAWRSATRVIERAAQHVQHTKALAEEKRASPARSSPARAAAPSCSKSSRAPGTRSSPAPTRSWTPTTRSNEWAAPLPRFEHALFVLRHRDEPAVARAWRSSTPASRPPASIRACRASGSGRACATRTPRTSTAGSEGQRSAPRAGREVAAGSRATATRPINLYDWYVCVRGGRGRGALADHRPRRAGSERTSTRKPNALQPRAGKGECAAEDAQQVDRCRTPGIPSGRRTSASRNWSTRRRKPGRGSRCCQVLSQRARHADRVQALAAVLSPVKPLYMYTYASLKCSTSRGDPSGVGPLRTSRRLRAAIEEGVALVALRAPSR